MFYRYYGNNTFSHSIHFESEEELDTITYECESDNPNYYFMRVCWKNVTEFFKDNNLKDGIDYNAEFYDYMISFKMKDDALMFKLTFGGQ